jgi:hypothetical protein
MKFIAHRINTIEELKKIPKEYGTEIDLRDNGSDIILQHDPFKSGENFEDYLKHYNHGTLILNVKSERIEHRILELLQKYKINDYFFLDCSFPMIYLLSNLGEKNIAIRFSEFEKIDTILTVKNRVNWVWVDCFSILPITTEINQIFKNAGLQTCLVSPELQGRDNDIEIYRKYLHENNITFDAICTKYYNIARWE